MRKLFLSMLLCFFIANMDGQLIEASFEEQIEESRSVVRDTVVKWTPYLKSEEVGVLKKNELVNAVDVGNGWAYVHTSTVRGYVNRANLAKQNGPSTIRKFTENIDVQKVILSSAVVKKSGQANSATVGKLKQGDVVKVVQEWGDYVWIESPYVKGYVHRKALQSLTATIKRVSSKSGVSVKPVPNLRPSALVILPQNAVVDDYGPVEEGWHIVQYGQVVGYVKSDFIGTTKAVKQYAKTNIVMQATMSHKSDMRSILPINTEVQVHSTSNGWAYVTVGTLKGYVMANELATKKQAVVEKQVGLHGLKVAHSSIKNRIVNTRPLRDEQGRQVNVYFIDVVGNKYPSMVGLQLAGDSNVYLQQYIELNGQLLTGDVRAENQPDILNIMLGGFSPDFRAFSVYKGRLHEFEELNGQLQYIGNNQYRESYQSNASPIYIDRIKVYELDKKTMRFILKQVEKDYYYEDYESSDA